VSFFKSGLDSHLLDLLWNKYWVNTLSASPLIANREFAAGQIADIAEKLEQVGWSSGIVCCGRCQQAVELGHPVI
jgi:COP9 signalosome complex subunit 5